MRSRTRAVVLLGAIGTVVALAAAPAQAYVYWADAGPGNPVSGTTIGRADLNGSAAVNSFVSGAKVPGPIAVGAGRVYWGNSQTNSIGAANLNGTGANESFIPNATNATDGVPTALALDGTHLYWSDGSEYIGRANLDGSSPQPHFIDAGFNSFPNGIAVAGGTIYITTGTQIVRVPTSGGSPTPVVQFSGGALLISLAVANGYLYAAEFDSNTGLASIA